MNRNNHVEGTWDELIRHPDWFSGQRVRVTILENNPDDGMSMLDKLKKWLAAGELLQNKLHPPRPSDVFGDALVDKYRTQGLKV